MLSRPCEPFDFPAVGRKLVRSVLQNLLACPNKTAQAFGTRPFLRHLLQSGLAGATGAERDRDDLGTGSYRAVSELS